MSKRYIFWWGIESLNFVITVIKVPRNQWPTKNTTKVYTREYNDVSRLPNSPRPRIPYRSDCINPGTTTRSGEKGTFKWDPRTVCHLRVVLPFLPSRSGESDSQSTAFCTEDNIKPILFCVPVESKFCFSLYDVENYLPRRFSVKFSSVHTSVFLNDVIINVY